MSAETEYDDSMNQHLEDHRAISGAREVASGAEAAARTNALAGAAPLREAARTLAEPAAFRLCSAAQLADPLAGVRDPYRSLRVLRE